ncbi:SDR family NAD(P)-dependent oxidoreductase [Salinispora oceanensis]|uniref:SDR family NAD(P)-dependent oxidoreductase n=1 Tax=Salinispora oceanensis TaxID=1050199 RepID=UPI0003806F28|nr:SDR family NAD(P)-dependent oxidoreductase [Salinispora oceanensis]
MQLQLVGKNAVVTGGSRGIGRGIVLALARAGANIITCYRQEGEAVRTLERELKETDGNHHLIQADISSREDVERLVEETRTRLGSIDVLVNNAGVISHVPFGELPLEEWQRVLDTNLTGSFLLIQKALGLLSERASVINIGSRAAVAGIPLRSHYTASKAGMIGLTRSLAKELGKRGIRVNLVAPGVIDTDEEGKLSDAEREQYRQRYQHMIALARFGRPVEIAGAVLFLASELSTYVTGETIHVDGGV